MVVSIWMLWLLNKKGGIILDVTKKSIAKKIYRDMDISFDISEVILEDDFVQVFTELMRDYTLIPTTNLIID